jgi:uncharacterized protein YihD (DUF1040 family)
MDYDYGDPRRIDRILALVSEGWHRYPQFRLGQFLEIVAESHELGMIPDPELERRLMDSATWQGPPSADAK